MAIALEAHGTMVGMEGVGAAANRGKAIAPSTDRLFFALLRLAAADDERGPCSLRSWRETAEASRIVYELARCGGNRSAAARALGIARRTLYCKMEKFGIDS